MINLFISEDFEGIKKELYKKLNSLVKEKLLEKRGEIYSNILSERQLNRYSVGRFTRIRRRVRRGKDGRVRVQRNIRRANKKGWRVTGNKMRRLSNTGMIQRKINLKRAWRSGRRSRLAQSLIRRRISYTRRKSMGI